MRPLAILATVLTCAAASAASAQSFTDTTLPVPAGAQTSATRSDDIAALAVLNGAAFAPRTQFNTLDPIDSLADRETYQPGAGLVRWMTGEAPLSPPSAGGPVDTLRVSVGGALRTPGGLPLNLHGAQYDPESYEVAITRNWPLKSGGIANFTVALP